MKAKIIKKAVAASLALALVSGSFPMQAASGLFRDLAVAAAEESAEENKDNGIASKYNAETRTLVLEGDIAYNTISEVLGEYDIEELKDGSVNVVVSEKGAVLTAADALKSDELNEKIGSIDLTGAKLEGDSARGMFSGFKKLKKAVLGSIITSEITDMSEMFKTCISLKTVEMSGSDTSKVTDTRAMFSGCTKLETVCVGTKWDMGSVGESEDMFRLCIKLTGGSGTKFDPKKTDAEYAVIDREDRNGYLTGVYTLTLPEDMTVFEEPAEEQQTEEEQNGEEKAAAKEKISSNYLKDDSVRIKFKDDADDTQVVRANGKKLACVDGLYTVYFAEETDVEITLEEFDPEAPHEHAYAEEITREPTCTEEGEKTFTCECGDSYTEVIPALGHDFSDKWTTDTEATCTEKGSKSHHCTRCDEKADVTEIPVKAHGRDKIEVTKPATCTEDGEQTVSCNCGESHTETIPAKGHSFSDKWTVDKKATCTEEGSKSHHCLVCGEKSDVTVIPKKGHTWSKPKMSKQPSCNEDGARTCKCLLCGQEKTDVIEAHGHDFSISWTIDKKPTCTTPGSKSHHCVLCGEKSDITEIPADLHDNPEFSYEIGDRAVKLTWDFLDYAKKYGIAVNENGSWKLLEEGYGRSYVMEDLEVGKSYKIAIVAKIDGVWNTADYSKAVTVRIDPYSALRYPEVTAEVTGTRVTLKWTQIASAENYGVAVYQGGKWVMVSDSLSAETDSYTSTRVGSNIYKMAVCTKRKGKWDITDIDNRAVFADVR
ncbi:MAG: DUF285 domain-containing protein [Ruminococcus sp.]|nr:DUF285 domain-containing protein [Ruminococcus sp.]